MSLEQWRDPKAVVIRGKLISEFTADELIALSQQLERELPATEVDLTPADVNKLAELDLIDDELDKRKH